MLRLYGKCYVSTVNATSLRQLRLYGKCYVSTVNATSLRQLRLYGKCYVSTVNATSFLEMSNNFVNLLNATVPKQNLRVIDYLTLVAPVLKLLSSLLHVMRANPTTNQERRDF
ncbi:hypothetical protein OGM63_23000 [Plectonema radiosum NIES-515]|uniref:Uncharacterized protein n=1 Tax=Plectonema radiosum NIES-515 TaxID=2986073 RepID=A0ABT3B4N9_9CYAN|nr:hypothetical protein [Plectonema radiosum]MCV3216344.1 hypothetical protein [Plectonema radiosum NIES-515]